MDKRKTDHNYLVEGIATSHCWCKRRDSGQD